MRPSRITGILLVVNWVLLTSAVWGAEGKDVAYRSGDETVHGLLFSPSGKGPFPGLLAIHAVFGLDAWTKEQASKLADAGYLVLALDFYQGKVAKSLDEGVQLSRAVPMARKQQDVLAAIHFLRSQANVIPDRVGSIGWCMGGRWAFQLATLDPLLKAAVIRYGPVSSDPSVLAKINAHILGIFGGKDTSIPIAEIRSFDHQMKGLGKQAEIVVYPEAGHAFEYPESTAKDLGLLKAAYPADAAYQGPRPDNTADAWKRTVNFLDTNLKSDNDGETKRSEGNANNSGAHQDILEVDHEWNEARLRSDTTTLNHLLADDWTLAHADGRVETKAQYIADFNSGARKFESYTEDDVRVRIHENTAVVTCLAVTKGQYKGQVTGGKLRHTRVWVSIRGRW